MIKRTVIIAFLLLPHFLYSAEKPNVLILFTDDQGTLDLNSYGASDLLTPNLDTLAAKGVRVTQTYSHTVCCPSRASLLTGRHPQRGGVVSWQQGDWYGSDSHLGNLAAEEVTIAEALHAAGYDTALFGKWHQEQQSVTAHSIRASTGFGGISGSSTMASIVFYTVKAVTISMTTRRESFGAEESYHFY